MKESLNGHLLGAVKFILSKIPSLTVIAVLTSVVLVTPLMGAGFSIPEVTIDSGKTANIPIILSNFEGLAGIKLVLEYDAKLLQYKGAKKTESTSGLMHIVNDKKPGRLVIVMAGAVGISGRDLVIINLSFEATPGLRRKETTEFKVLELQLMSEALKSIKPKIRLQPINIAPAIIQ